MTPAARFEMADQFIQQKDPALARLVGWNPTGGRTLAQRVWRHVKKRRSTQQPQRHGGRPASLFRRGIFRAHQRPSTCGSGRLGSNCHVWRHHAQAGKSFRAPFSSKISESLDENFPRMVPAELARSRLHSVLQQWRLTRGRKGNLARRLIRAYIRYSQIANYI